jgi:hypothetical protein
MTRSAKVLVIGAGDPNPLGDFVAVYDGQGPADADVSGRYEGRT